jgi:WD40 repeat protein
VSENVDQPSLSIEEIEARIAHSQRRHLVRTLLATLLLVAAAIVLLWVTIGSVTETDRELEASQTAALAALRHPTQVTSASFSPGGTYVVTACADGVARVWDWESGGKPVELLLKDASSHPLVTAVFSRSGRFVVTASALVVRVWEWEPEPKLLASLRQPDAPILGAALSPDERLVVTAGQDGLGRIWDWRASGRPRAVLRPEPAVPMLSVAFSSDGRFVATGSTDRARVWDIETRRLLANLPASSAINAPSVAFSPAGTRLAVASTDGAVRVWAWNDEEKLKATLLHSDEVTRATFSRDGDLIVTSSTDGAARVWDWREESSPPVVLRAAQPDPVLSAAFSPEGLVVVAGADRAARIYRPAEVGVVRECEKGDPTCMG